MTTTPPSDSTAPKPTFVTARTLKGFRDRMPHESIQKNKMVRLLQDVFERFGYAPIETPHLEYTEALLGNASAEIQKQVYRFTDNGGRDVMLRFDLTVPFARFISQHRNELGTPFKRWAIGSVFRGENPQAGRYREFTQCDFDFVGTTSMGADAETIQVIAAAMRALGIDDFTIRINNRRLMNAFFNMIGAAAVAPEALQIIDKIGKIGVPAVTTELSGLALSGEQVQRIMALVVLSNNLQGAALFGALEQIGEDAEFRRGVTELKTVVELTAAAGLDETTVRVDLAIARGLGYYTGVVYETFLNKVPKIGSVCSGGRYDNLTQTFAKEPLPGVGASVGLDRLIAALEELGSSAAVATPAALLIAVRNDADLGLAQKLGSLLRAAGIATEVYPEADKLGKQIKYAEKRGHRCLVLLGKQPGEFTLEELSTAPTKRQQTLPMSADGAAQARLFLNTL